MISKTKNRTLRNMLITFNTTTIEPHGYQMINKKAEYNDLKYWVIAFKKRRKKLMKNSKESAGGLLAKAGKYLTFKMGNEVFGLEILKVQEIIGMMNVTLVPKTPEFVRGVINLRGKVIPVIDLRIKFGLAEKEDTDRTCIIVVQVVSDDTTVIMGTLVDEVSEVLDINQEQIEPPPSFGTSVDLEFILGIGKVGEKVIMLLDVNKMLSGGEIANLNKIN